MREPREWDGLVGADAAPALLAARHRLADAAKDGDWRTVTRLLDTCDGLGVNNVRPDSPSWYTPLHQAAWWGAPASVVDDLVNRGGWRTLPDARGETPHDVAVRRRQEHLVALLEPRPARPVEPDVVAALDAHLADLIITRATRLGAHPAGRFPPVVVLTESPLDDLWCPVPGMHGGFLVQLRRTDLLVTSWSRILDGSEQTHLVTVHGATPVDPQAPAATPA